MAFTSVAALVGGEAATASLVLSAVAEVGTAMAVVGAVTGSKDLMKIGAVLGVAGGVGGMIAGASTGAADVAATAAGQAGDAAANTAADTATSAAADTSLDSLAPTAGYAHSGLDLTAGQASGLPDLSTLPATSTTAQTVGTQAAPLTDTAAQASPIASSTVEGTPLPGPAEVTGAQAPVGAQAPTTPADSFGSTFGVPTNLGTGYARSGVLNAPSSANTFWGKLGDFVKNNDKTTSAGLMLAGGALSGMNQRQIADQNMALQQQRINQTSYGSQVANFAPVGIIAGARQ